MIDLLQNKEFAHALLRRITDFQKARYARFLELAGDVLDVVLFADDVAGQEGLFISPQTYREMIKPYHAELMEWIKAHTKAPVLFHSCGSMLSVLDDFVEIGLKILNPVQVSAKGMDTAVLKQRYGQKITFWGAIDTHRTLPSGTPDEVRAEVRRRVADLGQGGGYVVAPVHVIQADVPAENIIAMCQEITSLN
jgi:uroporphyrinogen decarboxylase